MEHRATNQGERQSSAPVKRSWLMVIGCSLPFLAVLLLPLLGVSWGTVLILLAVLACPLMHLFGMHGSARGHGEGRSDNRGLKSDAGRQP